MLRSGATAFEYERSVQPQPKIGPWKEELDRILLANEAKSSRERLTLILIFELLRGLGYEGGYDAVRRYAWSWHREHAASSSPAELVVGDDIGALLRRGHRFDADAGDLSHAKRPRSLDATMSGKDHVLAVDEDGTRKAESADAVRDLPQLFP